MTGRQDSVAWNNFVMNSQPDDHPVGSVKRAAALAKNYMSGANGGGINSFLTNNWNVSGAEVLEALKAIGAEVAAKQYSSVLEQLGRPILASTQDERWDLLDECWPQDVEEEFDFLSDDAEKEIMQMLENHVKQNLNFYLSEAN